MQNGKVNIAQGYPETLSNLKIFMENQKRAGIELKTLADAIDFAIKQAEKVPALENEIVELKKRIAELVGIVESEYGIKGDE